VNLAHVRSLIYAETLGARDAIVAADMDDIHTDPRRRVELVRAVLADMQDRLAAAREEANR
jgi:hypothetical protein